MLNENGEMFWGSYNNIGIGAIAIASVLNHSASLSVPKSLLIIPMIVHRPTLMHMAHKNIPERGSAALVSSSPKLFINFNQRFESFLPLSINSIQFLVHLGYAELGQALIRKKSLDIDKSFGQRAQKIEKSSKKIFSLLLEDEEELYLNLRVQL